MSNNLLELRRQRAAYIEEADALVQLALNEGRALTEAERADIDSKLTAAAILQADIDKPTD